MSYDGSPPDPPQPDPSRPGASGDQPDPYAAPPPSNPYGGSHAAPPPPNPYGQPQPGPYGEPAPYGDPNPYGGQTASVPPPNPYGGQTTSVPPPNPYGGQPATGPAFVFGGYASWISRVVAYLIDAFLGGLAGFPIWIGYGLLISNATTTTDAQGVDHIHVHSAAGSTLLILIGVLTGLAFFVWNQCIRQGRTGATLGKSVLAIRTVHADMQPIGAGLAFLRYLLNIVNALPCYLGYLWPIWDDRKQTFADKIMSTYVIKASEPQPPVY
jgi:uncharacterized RDD family membrane protein YckC